MISSILILYASQTGNAQDAAETLQIELETRNIKTSLSAMDEYNIYIILGLGDTSYSKYNYVAKRLNNRLKQLSAIPLLPLELIDEQSDEGVLEKWFIKIWKLFEENSFLDFKKMASQIYLKPHLKYSVMYVAKNNLAPNYKNKDNRNISMCDKYYNCCMFSNKRVTPNNHLQDVRLLKIDISQLPVHLKNIQPFDVLSFQPENRSDTCSDFYKFYDLNPCQLIEITGILQRGSISSNSDFLQKYSHVLGPSRDSGLNQLTIGDLVKRFLNLQGVPRRSFFRFLCYYAHTAFQIANNITDNLLEENLNMLSTQERNSIPIVDIDFRVSSVLSELIKNSFQTLTSSVPHSNLPDSNQPPLPPTLYKTYADRLELERDKLNQLCSPLPDDIDELLAYSTRPRRNILEVLHDFPATSRCVPFDHLISIVGPITPRDFSIAGVNFCQDTGLNELGQDGNIIDSDIEKSVEILVAIVEYKSKLRESRKGTCSFWLSTLSENTFVPIKIKKGFVQIPLAFKGHPFIMVGPGTGIAPLRMLIRSRIQNGFKENYLFFGCRNQGKDQFFSDEFESYCRTGFLKLFNAFSRDQDEKIYVQDVIRRENKLVFRLMAKNDACFFISGRSKSMPDEVLKSLAYAFEINGDMSESAAINIVEKLLALKRIQMETWS
ncbi:unnamed protein product [Gordionus sp. m RMFG-2023]